jgi:hypothetical protein
MTLNRKFGLQTYHIKALNKSFNFVLITPFCVNYNLIYEVLFPQITCLRKKYAISEKLQHIKL